MRTPEQARDEIAQIAANFEIRPGRDWRSLEDTTNQPIISSHFTAPQAWSSWQRSYDYYPESDLIWLDADTKIRELSKGQKSLDDFAKLFFRINNGSYVTATYTFEDLLKTMDMVQSYDWKEFFRTRVYQVEPKVPENGITRGGYRLVYNDTEPDWMRHMDKSRPLRFDTSLGFSLIGGDGEEDSEGRPPGSITEVLWDGPAFKAGITPGMQLQAVNDQAFSIANLRETIVTAENSSAPIKLLLKRDKEFNTVMLGYHGGLRYPHLERIGSTSDLLDIIFAPVK